MTVKDDKKLKDMNTMTAGVSATKLEAGTTIDLHGQLVKIITSDSTETLVQYPNAAQRQFMTSDLICFRDLGTFCSGARFSRERDHGIECAYVEHIIADSYVVEIIAADSESRIETMLFANLIAWHCEGLKLDPAIKLPQGGQLYVPKTVETVAQQPPAPAQPEAIQFGQALVDDLRAKLDTANKNAEQAEINGQRRINDLQRKVGELNADLLRQHDQHTTELLGKNQEIDRLEAKAAIVLPTCKEFCITHDITAADLNKLSREGWQVDHMQFSADDKLNVVLSRDSSTDQPRARLTTEATAAAIYGTPAYNAPVQRPPVRQPPAQPVLNQTIIGLDAAQVDGIEFSEVAGIEATKPVSRALTNNGPKPGDTKRIPTLASIQARREADAAEIEAILQRGKEAHEVLNRQFANQPNRFIPTGAQ